MSDQLPKRCCPTDKPAAKASHVPVGETLYMSGPLDSKAGIVEISDIFGMHDNSKRVVDRMADAGFLVVMPDFFGKEAWPEEKHPIDFASAEWAAFFEKITHWEKFTPKVTNAIAVLRRMGCTKIGIVGMCWGSKLAFDFAINKQVDAVATAHPSILSADSVTQAKTPVCVMPSHNEPPMKEIEEAVKAHPGDDNVYHRFEHLTHGFLGARFDVGTSTEEEHAELEASMVELIDFFKRTLCH